MYRQYLFYSVANFSMTAEYSVSSLSYSSCSSLILSSPANKGAAATSSDWSRPRPCNFSRSFCCFYIINATETPLAKTAQSQQYIADKERHSLQLQPRMYIILATTYS